MRNLYGNSKKKLVKTEPNSCVGGRQLVYFHHGVLYVWERIVVELDLSLYLERELN